MGSTQTTVQQADPWAPAQPYILQGLDAAENLWQQGGFQIGPYQGQTLATMPDNMWSAISGMGAAQPAQSAYLGGAQGLAAGVGANAGANTFAPAFSQAIDNVMGTAQGSFGGVQSGGYATPQSAPNPYANYIPNNFTPTQIDPGGTIVQEGNNTPPTATPEPTTPDWMDMGGGGARVSQAQAGLQAGPKNPMPTMEGPRQNPFSGLQSDPKNPMPGMEAPRQNPFATGLQGQTPPKSDPRSNPFAQSDPRMTQGQYNAATSGPKPMNTQGGNPNAVSMPQGGTSQPGATPANQGIYDRVVEQIMPGINSTFAGSGMTGSSLHQSNLAQGLASGMADAELAIRNQQLQAGQMAQDAYMGNQNLALQSAGMAPGLSAATYNPYQQQLQAGQLEMGYGQALLDNVQEQFYDAEMAPLLAINDYLNLTSNLGGQFQQGQSTTSGSQGILGVLGGISPFLGLLSDRRAKRDIRRVGKTDSGLPVYTYRYKGEDGYHMGVMAQEVEKVAPEAVSTGPDGLKRVRYDMLEAA